MKYRLGAAGVAFEAKESFGNGGEGTVVGIPSRPDIVAKIFSAPTRAHEEKLREMCRQQPTELRGIRPHVRIAWPKDLVYADRQDQVVGYTMTKVSHAMPLASFCYPHLRGNSQVNRVVQVAIQICDTMASLHQDGYVVVDGNDANVLVSGANITWIDNDSFQIPATGHTLTSGVGHPEFTPAESIGRRHDIVLRPSHDYFSLAVMIFKLLFEGRHPFMCRSIGTTKPSLPERIQKGLWPYARRTARHFQPPQSGPNFRDLHPELLDLFTRCFEEGHRSPDRRPSASDWRGALRTVQGNVFPARAMVSLSGLRAVARGVGVLNPLPTVVAACDPDLEWSWEMLLDPNTWRLTVQLLAFCTVAIPALILILKTAQLATSLDVSTGNDGHLIEAIADPQVGGVQ